MRPSWLLTLALLPATALAQDIQPALDLTELSRGQVVSSTAKAQANRTTRRRPTANQIHACAQRPRFRRESPNDPKLRKLESLCRGVGL